MAKKSYNFKANYNGETIRPGEVMVPFEYTELDSANCTNRACIKTLKQGGRSFKVIYKAVPKKWAKDAKAAFNLIQNEALGHYDIRNSVSMDTVKDEYDLDLGEAPSAETVLMERADRDEMLTTFIELLQALIEKSPKIGYAVLLVHTNIKGEEFYKKMKLSRNPANIVRKQAAQILADGLENLDVGSLHAYKNQYDAEYRSEAYKQLDEIIKMF